jgi:hypothetical protein
LDCLPWSSVKTCVLLYEVRGTFLNFIFDSQVLENLDSFKVQVRVDLAGFCTQHSLQLRTISMRIIDFGCFTKQQHVKER